MVRRLINFGSSCKTAGEFAILWQVSALSQLETSCQAAPGPLIHINAPGGHAGSSVRDFTTMKQVQLTC